ncbi:MAG: hypothetical protein A2X79_07600 [Desulfuromonadaceae bacterium GWB2_53_15]|nr:MAG: hypothetical protein A2X79_07600 [Desulfuromonadaceae bacterium GWB2_53_15]
MRWDFLELIVLLLMTYSQIEMVSCAYLKQKNKYESFFCFYTSYSIKDYIEITREEKGRIGVWYWVFVFSVIVLVVAVVNVLASESGFGTNLNLNQDDIWPIL